MGLPWRGTRWSVSHVLGLGMRWGVAYRHIRLKPGKEHPYITSLRGGMDEYVRLWGEELSPQHRKLLLANDATALIACTQRRLITKGFSDVLRTIAVPTLLYAGSADPIHDAARQTASEIAGAEFVSLPGWGHVRWFRGDRGPAAL